MLGKGFGNSSDQLRDFDQQEDIDAEKRALRVLLDSFHVEPEALLEEALDNPMTRKNIGKFIGHTFIQPYSGE